MKQPFHRKKYYALTLDPVHVGTGGYRLGRVDNTITREPGTNLPKIPGSSLNGVTRAYTAMAIQSENYDAPVKQNGEWVIDYGKYRNWKYRQPDYDFLLNGNSIKYSSDGKAIIKQNMEGPLIKKENNKDIYLSCAGKGADDGEGHCGRPDCPVCVAFGFSKGKSGSSFQGLAQFFDGRILFFPVHSMVGPVWVTSPSVLESVGIKSSANNKINDWSKFNNELSKITDNKREEYFYTTSSHVNDHLNMGWIYLPKKEIKNEEKDMPNSESWLGEGKDNTQPKSLTDLGISSRILERLVIVSDSLFPRIVNDNLEVRTSVAIDPATGAAEDGALFTYEAIPRATIIWFEVVYNKPEYFHIKVPASNGIDFTDKEIEHGKGSNNGWTWILDNVEKGLSLIEHLGIGGMGTRGMGRVRILNKENTEQ